VPFQYSDLERCVSSRVELITQESFKEVFHQA